MSMLGSLAITIALHVMPDVFICCSEFQEHDPVSIKTESPVESSSAAATATDPDGDSVLKNFFNVCH